MANKQQGSKDELERKKSHRKSVIIDDHLITAPTSFSPDPAVASQQATLRDLREMGQREMRQSLERGVRDALETCEIQETTEGLESGVITARTSHSSLLGMATAMVDHRNTENLERSIATHGEASMSPAYATQPNAEVKPTVIRDEEHYNAVENTLSARAVDEAAQANLQRFLTEYRRVSDIQEAREEALEARRNAGGCKRQHAHTNSCTKGDKKENAEPNLPVQGMLMPGHDHKGPHGGEVKRRVSLFERLSSMPVLRRFNTKSRLPVPAQTAQTDSSDTSAQLKKSKSRSGLFGRIASPADISADRKKSKSPKDFFRRKVSSANSKESPVGTLTKIVGEVAEDPTKDGGNPT